MEFAKSEALTFGLELEFQIVNEATGLLSPSSLKIWEQLSGHENLERYSLEATLSTMEINSSIHTSADEMAVEITALTSQIRQIAKSMDLDIRGGGTQMAQFWNERIMAPTERAKELESRYGFLPKRFSTYGMHVHIGMPNGDAAIRMGNVLQALCPLFIAMSAASPFLQLADTGFAAARPLETLMYPHGGPMPELRDWAELEEVTEELFATELANSLKDIYWDVRPKPEFGTVEIRVFDTPLSVRKAVAMAAFARACAALALDGNMSFSSKATPNTAQRVSRFLACRDGMNANLYNAFTGDWISAREWFAHLYASIQKHPIYAVDGAHIDYLSKLLEQRQDHEVMRETWSKVQAKNPTPDNLSWSLPHYATEICSLLL